MALRFLALAFLLPLVIACGPAGTGGGVTGGTAEHIGSDGDPKYGGIFLLGMSDTPENTHLYVSLARGTQATFNHYYEKLVIYDQKGEWRTDQKLMPVLAESWEQPNDTTVVFQIRQGVKWHDGRPFTAQDAAWSLNYLIDPANKFRDRSLIPTVTSVTAEGERLRLSLSGPTPNLLAALRDVPIMPRHIFEAGGAEALATRSTSTGPYELVSMERTSRTKFKRSAGYWGKDEKGRQLPFMDGIDIIHNMDAAAQRAAFAAGQNDVLSFPDRTELQGFTQRLSNKELKVIEFHYASGPGFLINFKRGPFTNPDVRKAVNLVINRHAINENFSSGEGLFATPIISAFRAGWGISQEEMQKRPGWRPNKEQDLQEARSLLQKHGMSPGDVEFRAIANATFGSLPQAEQAASQLRQFGFRVRLDPLDGATMNKEYQDGNWDLAWQVWTTGEDAASNASRVYHSKGGDNRGGVNDPELDAIIDKLVITTDREEQKRLARQAQAIALDRTYSMPVIQQKLFHVAQPWVNDWRTGRANQADLNGSTPFTWIDVDKLPSGGRPSR